MHYVIGSGPSGVACATALLDRGLSVTMLDAGLDLEDERQRHRQVLASTSPADWPPESVAALAADLQSGPGGVPLKRVFGSDFPFRPPGPALPLRQDGTHAVRSFARGGLSRAWGATLLPAAAADVRHWVVPHADLEPHYKAVMQWVPLAAVHDGLDDLFPMYVDRPGDLKPSRQARGLLESMTRQREALAGLGVVFGRARLAVQHAVHDGRSGCVQCRHCLQGCPYDCIFSADQLLPSLISNTRFSYRGGILVRRLEESADAVRIEAIDLATNAVVRLSGTAVFLAAGVITTSQLLMDALAIDRVEIRTSQSFLMPLLKTKADTDVRRDEAHALSQIFLLIRNTAIADRLIQLQIYTYSSLVSDALDRSAAGPLFRLSDALKRRVEDRLVVLQGLLPSEQSDSLTLTKEADSFVLRGSISDGTRAAIRRVARVVQQIGSTVGFRALTPLLRVSAPGQSFHSGASFPMSDAGTRFVADRLGRPGGLRRIHAVDATVLPDIPAPPLTLTVMANAHRIGAHAD